MNAPFYLPYYVLIGSVGIIAVLMLGLARALERADWPAADRRRVLGITGAVLVGWFVAVIALGRGGAFEAGEERIPTIQFGIFIPILIGAWLLWRSPKVKQILDAVPQSWIVGLQLYRALGVIFLILYAGDRLPGLFAWPAGLGDILVGLLAPFVAMAYARRPEENARTVAAWNIFGLADLAVAVSAGFITAPSPLFAYEPANTLISIFPLVLIPTFLVPISVLLHVASLAKLRQAGRAKRDARNMALASI
ncbi:MAG TPA: MFS transporter [Methyloceanibacter sp.]|nr:MFS transporter [Methyloceanibacter sp.]